MFTLFKKKSDEAKTLGQQGELFAQEEYKRQGYKIIARNEYNKKGKQLGEIDFIATDKKKIVFVEVKTRTAGIDKFGKGVESVNVFKQRKILLAVKMYLLRHPEHRDLQPQIDVCLIESNPQTTIKNNPASKPVFNGFDKRFKPAIIISNVVEDFN